MKLIDIQGDYYNPAAIAAIRRDGDSDEFQVYLYGSAEPLTHTYGGVDECRDEMDKVAKNWQQELEGATHA